MQSQENMGRQEGPVQVARYRFSSPVQALVERLSVGSVGIALRQDIAVAIFVKWVLQGVSMRWEFGC